jgi:hypothetical protein
MQSNGPEMLRLACSLATEAGLTICAPVHDAILLEAPLERLEADVAKLRGCMSRASMDVLDGFEIGTDAKLIRWPDRYSDPRGEKMWERIMSLLEQIEGQAAQGIGRHQCPGSRSPVSARSSYWLGLLVLLLG